MKTRTRSHSSETVPGLVTAAAGIIGFLAIPQEMAGFTLHHLDLVDREGMERLFAERDAR